MKKINLLVVVMAGAFAVACNGGGSSNNSGGSTSDACANGAATCGALSSAESVEKVIPLNALPVVGLTALTGANEPIIKSTTNLYLSNQESAFISFGVESNGVTQPFIMDFKIRAKFETTVLPKFVATTSAGQNANQCKFPADVNGSYICTLTISPNNAPAGAYEISGTIVNGNQPFEINVVTNYQEPTSFTLPLGTYQVSGNFVSMAPTPVDDPKPFTELCSIRNDLHHVLVNTSNRIYECYSEDYYPEFHSSAVCYDRTLNNTTFPVITLPTMKDFIWSGDSLINGSWNGISRVLTGNQTTAFCPGFVGNQKYTYVSDSTQPPFPVYVPQ